MDFRRELTEFPSLVHSVIYTHARGVVPLARSLAAADDPKMRVSCEGYHQFYMDMLSDMYDYPGEYALPAGVIEEFSGGRKINGVKRKFPAKTKTLLAHARNAVHGYTALLCLLGQRGELRGEALSVSPEDLASIGKSVSTSVSPIPLERRLKALSRAGLVQAEEGFVSTRYPHMFPAMCALAKRGDKISGFDFFAFQTLDYRNLAGRRKPDYSDYFLALSERQRANAHALHDYAIGAGLKYAINTFNKVDYKYKGVQVMCVASEHDLERVLDIRVTCAYYWDDQSVINDLLAKEPTELQKEALRHVWRCNACATTHLGRFVTVLGRRQRVCGGGVIGFRWQNPKESDLENIRRIIELRRRIIDGEKARKKRA